MNILNTLIPIQPNVDLSTFRVMLNGKPLNDKYSVSAIMVHKSVNKIPFAQLLIADGDVAKQDFAASSSDEFVPGGKVKILMGYKSIDTVVFEGIIIKHSIQLIQGKATALTVELKDESVKMTIGRNNKIFENKLDSAIISSILNKHSVSGTVEPTKAVHEEMVQFFCTDWDFVLARAEANGMLVFVNDGKVSVKTPDVKATALPELTVSFGANVFEFEAEMDARDDYKSVAAKTWDDATREVVTKETKKGLSGGIALPGTESKPSAEVLADVIGLDEFPLQHSGQLKSDELEAWADAKLMRSRLAKIKGRVKINGYSKVKPGDQIGITNFSKRFNGVVFVSAVTHSLSTSSAFYTEIQFGYSQEWFSRRYNDVVDMPASGLLPSVYGLQVGIVKQISEDPQSDYRVKVSLPLIEGAEGVWARLATLDAGQERGTFFYPEVDDEVILGFMNDDPREPVILGMLYSGNSKGKPPLEPTAENFKKGIYTKSKIKIEFDDKNQSVLIETPGGNSILVADKKDNADDAQIVLTDANNNKIEMNKEGITITSGKDLNLKATGDIKIEGVNITQSADGQLKSEGNGGVELSSSANTVVKGSVVQIN